MVMNAQSQDLHPLKLVFGMLGHIIPALGYRFPESSLHGHDIHLITMATRQASTSS